MTLAILSGMRHDCDRCGEPTDELDLVDHDDEFWCTDCVKLDKYGYWELEAAVLKMEESGAIGFDWAD